MAIGVLVGETWVGKAVAVGTRVAVACRLWGEVGSGKGVVVEVGSEVGNGLVVVAG